MYVLLESELLPQARATLPPPVSLDRSGIHCEHAQQQWQFLASLTYFFPPWERQRFEIVFPEGAFPVTSPGYLHRGARLESKFVLPDDPSKEFRSRSKGREFGLELKIMEEIQQRVMYHDFDVDRSAEARRRSSAQHTGESYYAFDDDARRNPYNMYDDNSIAKTHRCRRTSLHRRNPVSCNPFHELGIADNTVNLNFHYLK
jgi:hypothetical protein